MARDDVYRDNKCTCPECNATFVYSTAGMRAFYWHLRIEHGYIHDDAFDVVGAS